jgi:tRNA(Ile)-lysidine synthase
VITAACVAPPNALRTERGARQVFLDADAIRPPLVLRTRRSGDRIQPLGMTGTRKVQDVLTDHKVPVSERDGVPIIADAEGILWIAGHVLSERARIRAGVQQALLLEIQEELVVDQDPT